MNILLGRLLCTLLGHRRRTRKNEPLGRGQYLECPRCGAWESAKPRTPKPLPSEKEQP